MNSLLFGFVIPSIAAKLGPPVGYPIGREPDSYELEADALLVAFDRIAAEEPDDCTLPRTTTSYRFKASVKHDIRSDALDGKWSSMDPARVEREMRSYLAQIEYAAGDGYYRGRRFEPADKHFIDNVIGGFIKLLDQATPEAKVRFLTPFMKRLRPTNVPWKKKAKAVADARAAEHAAWQRANPGRLVRSFARGSALWDEVDRYRSAVPTGDAINLAKARSTMFRNRGVSK